MSHWPFSPTAPTRRHALHALAAAPLAAWLGARAAAPAPAADAPFEIPAEAARADLALLRRGFEALHPGLYRYATPAQIEAEFGIAEAAVAQGSDRGRMFLLATRLAAAVRCGHTWTNPLNQSAAVKQQVFDRADKLPLTLRLVQGRFIITGAALPGLPPLPLGSELLAIDGRTPEQIVRLLMPHLRADGSSDGKRLAQIDSNENGGAMDRLFPLLVPPSFAGWRLRIRPAGSADVVEPTAAPVMLAERERAIAAAAPSRDWRFSVQRDVATLTLPTFSFWGGKFDGRAFLARAFAELADKQVPFLIVDIRRNEGGDDALGHALLAHLLKTPYTLPAGHRESAYEQVSADLLPHLDTWDRRFYDRRGQVVRGPGRNWRLPDPAPVTITPVAAPYAGRSLMLVGPQNSSAGFLLARDTRASGAATLVGRPTGGNLRGLNGGQLAWLTLPASGVAVDIPLVAGFIQGDPPDAGVAPNVTVPENFGIEAGGIDTEMVAALRVIGGWRSGVPRRG